MSVGIKNPELYARMKALIDKSMALMQPDLKEAWDIRTKILQKSNPFFYTLLSSSKPKFQYLINRYKHYDIEKLPEFKECENLIRSDKAVSRYINRHVGTSRGLEWIWSSHHVYYILEMLVQKYFYTQKYEPELFDSLYHDFETMCYEGVIPVRDIAPLHNFDVSDLKRTIEMTELITHGLEFFAFKPVHLEKGLRIKQLTKEENLQLFNLKESGFLTLLEVGEPEFAIECDVNEPIVGQIKANEKLDEKYQSEDTIDAVITALRLFRSSFIAYSNIFPFKDLDVFIELKYKAKNIIAESQFDKRYTLSHKELTEFQSFWKNFGSLLKENSKWSELNSAIAHFNSSYTRWNDRDKLIDLSISVEALFRDKSRIGGEISHRNSLRMARLLQKSNNERQKIYMKMKNLSVQRGGAVHASSKDKFDYRCLQDLVREALIRYLERVKADINITHEEIINSLDYD